MATPKLKVIRPPKHVLVKNYQGYWVLSREWYETNVKYNKDNTAEVIAESDDRKELERFRNLAEET